MWRWWLLIVCGCSAPPRAVEIPAPLAKPPVSIVSLGDEAPLGPNVVIARSAAEGSWAATFPEAKAFTSTEVPKSSRVVLHFRVGATRKVKDLPPNEDYPANYVSSVDLIVRSRDVEKTITLGELAGSVDPAQQSYCSHAGWDLARWPSWGVAPNRSVAAWFAVGVMQGDSEFMIVRDGDTIHVIHRETSDGSCQEARQGPLSICEGSEWERVAEIHGTRDAGLFERITEDGKDIDCGAQRMGEQLTKP